MFETAARLDHDDDIATAAAAPLAAVEPPVAAPYERGGRYGEKRGVNVTTIAGVVALHVAVFVAAASLSPQFAKHERHRLKVVEMRLDAPPPPPPTEQPKQPPKQIEAVKLAVVPQAPRPPILLAPPPVATPIQLAAAPVPAAPPAAPDPGPPAPPAKPSTIQGGNIGAQMISGKPPRYPIECRRKREQGTVVLALTLSVDGRVASLAIQRSSGHARLDDAARDAVRNWRWAPITRDGQPVIVRGVVEIPFVLQG